MDYTGSSAIITLGRKTSLNGNLGFTYSPLSFSNSRIFIKLWHSTHYEPLGFLCFVAPILLGQTRRWNYMKTTNCMGNFPSIKERRSWIPTPTDSSGKTPTEVDSPSSGVCNTGLDRSFFNTLCTMNLTFQHSIVLGFFFMNGSCSNCHNFVGQEYVIFLYSLFGILFVKFSLYTPFQLLCPLDGHGGLLFSRLWGRRFVQLHCSKGQVACWGTTSQLIFGLKISGLPPTFLRSSFTDKYSMTHSVGD